MFFGETVQKYRLYSGGILLGIKGPQNSFCNPEVLARWGLAMPDMRSYFFASQLVFLHWRCFPQIPNATTLLEAAVATSQETLLNMMFRKEIPGRMVGSVMALPGKVFHLCAQRMRDDPLWMSPNCPLWCNKSLREFCKIEDGYRWAKYGIKYLHHIYQDGKLISFVQLREQFGMPGTWHFRYTQLQHAATAQFGSGEVEVQNTNLEKVLIDPEPTKRISRYYREIGLGGPDLTDKIRTR